MPSQSRLLVSSALLLVIGGCATAGRSAKLVEITPATTAAEPGAKPDDALYQAAVTAIERRDYALALDALQAARARSPDDARVWNAMGVVYDKLGRFDLSARYYAQAQELDPGSRVVAENQAYSAVLQQTQVEPRALAAVLPPDVPRVAPAAVLQPEETTPTPVIRAEAPAQSAPAARPVLAAAPVPRTVERPQIHESATRLAAVAAPLARWAAPVLEAFTGPTAPQPVAAAPMAMAKVAPERRPIVAAAAAPLLISRSPTFRRTEIRPIVLTAAPPAAVPAPVDEAPPLIAAALPRPAPVIPSAAPPHVPPVAPKRLVVASKLPSAPVRIATAPTSNRIALARNSAPVILIGRPLLVVNASGRRGGAELVRLKLASRGWSAPVAAVRPGEIRAVSTIRYASRNVVVARALARTLPYRLRLESCGATCRGVTLYIGADALRWNRARTPAPAYRGRA